jgi:hypothetical protein
MAGKHLEASFLSKKTSTGSQLCIAEILHVFAGVHDDTQYTESFFQACASICGRCPFVRLPVGLQPVLQQLREPGCEQLAATRYRYSHRILHFRYAVLEKSAFILTPRSVYKSFMRTRGERNQL